MGTPKILQPKISARFRTSSRLDHGYLWNATRHRQSEKCFANYGHSRTGKLNSVYFGPQTAKNSTGVLSHPTGGHHAGHCHASSFRRLHAQLHIRHFSTVHSVCIEKTDRWAFIKYLYPRRAARDVILRLLCDVVHSRQRRIINNTQSQRTLVVS